MELKRVSGTIYSRDGLPKFIQPDELVVKLSSHGIRLTQKQLLDMAASGQMPAFFFGDNKASPFFLWKDVQEWIADNLLWRSSGAKMTLQSIRLGPHSARAEQGIPAELSALGHLCELSTGQLPTVYFLCLGGRVVYVGQTTELSQRIKNHGDKIFDRVFYILVPQHELDRIERFWIAELRPKYNTALVPKMEVVEA